MHHRAICNASLYINTLERPFEDLQGVEKQQQIIIK